MAVVDIRDNVGTAGDGLLAGLAVPDASGVALDGYLAAECAGVSAVLLNFDLLHLLTEGGTVAAFILSVYCPHHPCSVVVPVIVVDIEEALRGSVAYRVPYLPVIPTSEEIVSSVLLRYK